MNGEQNKLQIEKIKAPQIKESQYSEIFEEMKEVVNKQYYKNLEEKVVRWCRKNCTNDITLEEILDTKRCNFCDIAFELVELEKKINGETIEKEGE